MTKEDILAMEAGPQLDALVAERVMGWRGLKSYPSYEVGQVYDSAAFPVFGPTYRWFGLPPLSTSEPGHPEHANGNCVYAWENEACECQPADPEGIHHYSTDIAAAWEVIQKMAKTHPSMVLNNTSEGRPVPIGPGHFVEFQPLEDGRWFVGLWQSRGGIRSNGDGCAHGDTLPLAICRAALLTTIDGSWIYPEPQADGATE